MKKELKEEPKQIVLSVKGWKRGIKYPCPLCGKKVGTNSENKYLCEPCNVVIKPVINF
jgi:predicted RNA-binding Zn-ribbon protein involved in translation (DUF1610 family)